MDTNTKRNEHPACSCTQCRIGAGTCAGQYTHTQVNRAIRRRTKAALKKLDPEDFSAVIVPTPYTD